MARRTTAGATERNLKAEMRSVGKRLDALVSAARTAEAGMRAKSMPGTTSKLR